MASRLVLATCGLLGGCGFGFVASDSDKAADGDSRHDVGDSNPDDNDVGDNDPGGDDGGLVNPPWEPPTCSGDGSLPSNAPTLELGVWTYIAPIPNFYANGVAFDPCNPATLYTAGGNYQAAGGNGDTVGVFRSTNAGATWEHIVELDSPARVRVDPDNNLRLYVVDGVNGGTMGFWRSTNGGATWDIPEGFLDAISDPSVGGNRDMYDVAPDPTDFSHVLVTFHSPWPNQNGSGILESFDGGDTWTIHQPLLEWDRNGHGIFFLYEPSLGIGNSQTWLYGDQSAGYWRTTDGGDNWDHVISDATMTHEGAQIYYTQQGVLYVSMRGEPNGTSGISRSTDNGATWQKIPINGVQYNGTLSIFGDGENLYTGPWNGAGIYTAKEDDDTDWALYDNQGHPQPQDGPYMMAFDQQNRILYSANSWGGLWTMKRQ